MYVRGAPALVRRCHGDDQLAVAQADVEFAADGEAELLQPAAAQAQRGDALVAVGVVAVADGAVLRGTRVAWAAAGWSNSASPS
ncbi:hypothetical protein SP73_26420, partial [Xanthomonas citri pv. fuscans]